jgi:hypothetical protein
MNLTPVSNDTLCSNNELTRKVHQYNSAPKLTKKVPKTLTIISNFHPTRGQMFNDYLKQMSRD